MRRGRLWLISRRLPVHGSGGMERVVDELARGLAGRGWEMDLVTTRVASRPALPPEIELHALDAPDRVPAGRFAAALLRWERAQRARRGPPDLILAATFAAGPLVARRPEIPAVFQAHGSSWAEAVIKLRAADPRGLLRLWLYLSAERRYLHRYDRIVAVGPAVAGYFASPPYGFLDRRRVVEIANGIDLGPLGGNGEERRRLRERLRLADGERLVVSAGRLIPEKGARDLLRAYARLEGRERVRVVIAGGGRDEAYLREFVRRHRLERVEVPGALPRERVLELVRAADLVVQVGTRPEGLPLIVLEALCVGCPVMIADGLALPAFGGEAGVWRTRAADPSALAASLAAALRGPGPLPEVARAARASFSLARMVDAYERVFAEVRAERAHGDQSRA